MLIPSIYAGDPSEIIRVGDLSSSEAIAAIQRVGEPTNLSKLKAGLNDDRLTGRIPSQAEKNLVVGNAGLIKTAGSSKPITVNPGSAVLEMAQKNKAVSTPNRTLVRPVQTMEVDAQVAAKMSQYEEMSIGINSTRRFAGVPLLADGKDAVSGQGLEITAVYGIPPGSKIPTRILGRIYEDLYLTNPIPSPKTGLTFAGSTFTTTGVIGAATAVYTGSFGGYINMTAAEMYSQKMGTCRATITIGTSPAIIVDFVPRSNSAQLEVLWVKLVEGMPWLVPAVVGATWTVSVTSLTSNYSVVLTTYGAADDAAIADYLLPMSM